MSVDIKKEVACRQKEEELLCFTKFSNEDALQLGLKVIEKAKEWGVAVAVEVEVNGVLLFQHMMKGACERNTMWIQRKQNIVRTCQMSSYHSHQWLINEGKEIWKDWRLDEAEYGAIGGGFPIILKDTGIIGSVSCSGLPHWEDHRLLVETLCDVLGVDLNA